jgi:hypothetical protein
VEVVFKEPGALTMPYRSKSVLTSTSLLGKLYQNLKALGFGSPENRVYGNSSILSLYAGLTDKSIRGRYQHGWPAHSKNDLYYKNNYLPTFVWSEEAEFEAKKKGWNNFFSIGSPWIYMLEILDKDGWKTNYQEFEHKKISTLWVYGRHSLEVNLNGNKELVGFLRYVNAEARPGDLCLLYFEDFDSLSITELAKFEKLEIVTLGQRSSSFISEAHLVRIYHILRTVSIVKLDHPSTLALYALTLGVKVSWIQNSTWREASNRATDLGLFDLIDFMNSTPNESLDFVNYAYRKLGSSSIKSRKELRELLGWENKFSEIFKTFALSISTLVFFPARYLRINFLTRGRLP